MVADVLKYHPQPGALLLCNYQPGFVAPEMVKRRVVVVMTPRLRRREGLCTVIPLSTTAPSVVCDYHVQVPMRPELPAPWQGETKWAKADMLATVGFHRLHPIGLPRRADGGRRYLNQRIGGEEFKRIQLAMLAALNLGILTDHPYFAT